MSYSCFKCGKELTIPAGSIVGRGDECPHCRADMRVCRNCAHFDPQAYNQCRETQAERVVEKERANFCDYFSFGSGAKGASASPKDAALKKLDDLFK